MGHIYVTGDTHGNIQRFYPNNWEFLDKLTLRDYVVVLGDFGFLYCDPPTKEEQKELEYLSYQKYTTLFIDGNHDNHNLINSYPNISMFGGIVNKINDKVYHLKRGEIYNILDKTFFCFGGAYSVDKCYRTPNLDWWATEYPTDEEIQNAEINLKKFNYKIDYVLTHTVQTSIVDYMDEFAMFPTFGGRNVIPDYVSKVLEHLLNNITYEHQYFGHFHIDKQIDDKHTCLYYSYRRIL